MNVSLDHINISVQKFDEVIVFYKAVFSMDIVEEGSYGPNQRWKILRSGGFMMCIYESDKLMAPDEFLKVNHFAIRTDDEAPILAALDELGVEILSENIVEYPHSKSWYVKDPSGFGIEVVKWNNGEIRFPL